MFIDAICDVGNYGDIFERHIQDALRRQSLNLLNTGDSGLLCWYPFGRIVNAGPEPKHNELAEILDKGNLRCGTRHGIRFGDFDWIRWTGMDTDYCRSLSASLFGDVRGQEWLS